MNYICVFVRIIHIIVWIWLFDYINESEGISSIYFLILPLILLEIDFWRKAYVSYIFIPIFAMFLLFGISDDDINSFWNGQSLSVGFTLFSCFIAMLIVNALTKSVRIDLEKTENNKKEE